MCRSSALAEAGGVFYCHDEFRILGRAAEGHWATFILAASTGWHRDLSLRLFRKVYAPLAQALGGIIVDRDIARRIWLRVFVAKRRGPCVPAKWLDAVPRVYKYPGRSLPSLPGSFQAADEAARLLRAELRRPRCAGIVWAAQLE